MGYSPMVTGPECVDHKACSMYSMLYIVYTHCTSNVLLSWILPWEMDQSVVTSRLPRPTLKVIHRPYFGP